MRKQYPTSSMVTVMGSDLLARAEEEDPKSVGWIVEFLRTKTDLSVVVSGDAEKTRSGIARTGDVYLSMLRISGTLVLEPHDPWAGLYAFVPDGKPGISTPKLVPIT